MSAPRILEDASSIYSLMDEFLVVCPRCEKRARVFKLDPECLDWFSPRRVVCEGCGFRKDWAGKEIAHSYRSDVPRDSYFLLPLWLRTECCGETLWAYNLRHLSLLEAYIGAGLREHSRDLTQGWANRSWMNRLPAWMTSRKNRKDVLKGLATLRKRLV